MDSSKGQRGATQLDNITNIQNNQEAWEQPQVIKQTFFCQMRINIRLFLDYHSGTFSHITV